MYTHRWINSCTSVQKSTMFDAPWIQKCVHVHVRTCNRLVQHVMYSNLIHTSLTKKLAQGLPDILLMYANWIPSIVMYLFKWEVNGVACYSSEGRNTNKFVHYVSKPVLFLFYFFLVFMVPKSLSWRGSNVMHRFWNEGKSVLDLEI